LVLGFLPFPIHVTGIARLARLTGTARIKSKHLRKRCRERRQVTVRMTPRIAGAKTFSSMTFKTDKRYKRSETLQAAGKSDTIRCPWLGWSVGNQRWEGWKIESRQRPSRCHQLACRTGEVRERGITDQPESRSRGDPKGREADLVVQFPEILQRDSVGDHEGRVELSGHDAVGRKYAR
jgi:hypothetical protein